MLRWPARVQAILGKKAEAFFSLEGAVRSGKDPAAIHDMRVASRRLQEVLRLVFPDHPDFREPLRILRRARRVQSPVRDLDVMIARLGRMEKKAGGETGAALRFLRGSLVALRRRRHRKMAELLGDLGLARLKVDLEALVTRSAQAPAASLTRSEVTRRARDHIQTRGDLFGQHVLAARAALLPADLHQVRIAGKRLRYAMEIADELRIAGYKKRIARLRDVQQALGHWHDLEVLEEAVLDITTARSAFQHRLPVVRATCDLIASWREEKKRLVQEYLRLVRQI